MFGDKMYLEFAIPNLCKWLVVKPLLLFSCLVDYGLLPVQKWEAHYVCKFSETTVENRPCQYRLLNTAPSSLEAFPLFPENLLEETSKHLINRRARTYARTFSFSTLA